MAENSGVNCEPRSSGCVLAPVARPG